MAESLTTTARGGDGTVPPPREGVPVPCSREGWKGEHRPGGRYPWQDAVVTSSGKDIEGSLPGEIQQNSSI